MFHSIKRFLVDLKVIRGEDDVEFAKPEHRSRYTRHAKIRVTMQVVLSLALLGAGLYILISGGYEHATQEWATGWIGVVVGYWLR